jgi:excisionase family DNA binding protein
MTRLMTVRELADALGISRSVVYEYVSSGLVASIHLGRARRITAEEYERIVREGLPVMTRRRSMARDPAEPGRDASRSRPRRGPARGHASAQHPDGGRVG